MLKKVGGIVLRTTKYSESSVICAIYTQELGLRTYIMNGVRKKNSKVSPALLRPMSLVEMVVYHQEEKDINRIKEIKPSFIYEHVPFNVVKGAVGLFITEVAQKTVKEPEPNIPLFNFLTGSYHLLDKTNCTVALFPIWFLVQFTPYLGLAPIIQSTNPHAMFDYAEGQMVDEAPTHHYYFSAEHTQLLSAFLELNYETCSQLNMDSTTRKNLLDDMLKYYQYHIENFGELNAVLVMQTVFA